MTDEFDRASDQEMQMLERTIAWASSRPPELTPIGECYNCSAALPEGHRFCDSDCRDDYQKRMRK